MFWNNDYLYEIKLIYAFKKTSIFHHFVQERRKNGGKVSPIPKESRIMVRMDKGSIMDKVCNYKKKSQ